MLKLTDKQQSVYNFEVKKYDSQKIEIKNIAKNIPSACKIWYSSKTLFDDTEASSTIQNYFAFFLGGGGGDHNGNFVWNHSTNFEIYE